MPLKFNGKMKMAVVTTCQGCTLSWGEVKETVGSSGGRGDATGAAPEELKRNDAADDDEDCKLLVLDSCFSVDWSVKRLLGAAAEMETLLLEGSLTLNDADAGDNCVSAASRRSTSHGAVTG
jgi:hypothetical protein